MEHVGSRLWARAKVERDITLYRENKEHLLLMYFCFIDGHNGGLKQEYV
jgi:hypothetical protein